MDYTSLRRQYERAQSMDDTEAVDDLDDAIEEHESVREWEEGSSDDGDSTYTLPSSGKYTLTRYKPDMYRTSDGDYSENYVDE